MYDEKYYKDKQQKKVNAYTQKLEQTVMDLTNVLNSAWKDLNSIKAEYQELFDEEKKSKEEPDKKSEEPDEKR